MKKTLLEFNSVYAGTQDLPTVRNLNFVIFEGEYIGIVGADGFVMQTLVRLFDGSLECSGGEIIYSGLRYTPRHIREAQQKKVFCISSESNLVDSQTIAENFFLNHSGKRMLSYVNDRLILNETQSILHEFGLNLNVRVEVARFSPAMKCILEMIKFYVLGARLVVLHDIMTLGTEYEYELFRKVVEKITATGASVLFLSNRYLDELLGKADRLMLISRDGRLARTLYQGEFSKDQINLSLSKMTPEYKIFSNRTATEKEVLRVENLFAGAYEDVNLVLHENEVLGLYYSDIRQEDDIPFAISGQRPYTGQLYICGKPVAINSPGDAIKCGIGLIPSDPGKVYFSDLSIEENITLLFAGRLSKKTGVIDASGMKSLKQDAEIVLRKFEAEFPRLEYENCMYSIITRFLLYPFRVVIVMHPSLKNDAATTNMLFRFIDEAAEKGCGVMVVSTQLEELQKICDRVCTLNDTKYSKP